ncbi:hypothetical protein G6F27_008478 [Rhizopus arrhizus]|nr:hypothetical protein G6F27_008478 [Rhizopus arrhizus]
MNASHCTIVYLCSSGEDEDQQFLLESVFVHVEHSVLEAIEKVKEMCKNNHPTLFLIDLDAIKKEEVSQWSISEDGRIDLIQKVIRDLSKRIPLVVCSKENDTNTMLNCIHAGAVYYLFKPLHLVGIKTLFLKLHRNQPDLKMHHLPLYQRIKEMSCYNVPKIMMSLYASSQKMNYTSVSRERSSELQSRLRRWDFGPFDLTEQELIECVYLIFDQLLSLPELDQLNIKQDQLYEFIVDLSSVYHDDNPYHNFAHAVDVLQCLFFMLCELGLLPFTNKVKQQGKPQDMLSAIDIFALFIAAIGHDAAHPGVNNMFLVNTSNPLATLYNDQSILENLHSVTLFQLLNKHGIDKSIGEDHAHIIKSILATDMALHSDYVEKIQQQAKRLDTIDVNTLDCPTLEKERILLCSALIKCADISNVARSFEFGQQWAHLLVQEFSAQDDLEKQLGLPPSTVNNHSLEDSQIGFIRFVALGLFQSVSEVIQELSFAVDQLTSNLERWEALKWQKQEEENRMMMRGIKRSLSIDDTYSSKKRVSLEKFNLSMPLIAMTTHVNTEDDDQTTLKRPAYCQCSIQ